MPNIMKNGATVRELWKKVWREENFASKEKRESMVYSGKEGARLCIYNKGEMSLEDSTPFYMVPLNGPEAQKRIGSKARPKTKPNKIKTRI